jgi:DNA polymerase elongation subunit (family B)
MLSPQELQKCLVVDIETVSQEESFEALSLRMKQLWTKKSLSLKNQSVSAEKDDSELYETRSAIYAEFGKIICISCGYFSLKAGEWSMRIKSFYGKDEASLLKEFSDMLRKSAFSRLCAHNGKEFDFPYLCRRMLIQNIDIPDLLNIQGKKPWETPHLDTMELWKFGDHKSFTSLDLLSAVLGISSPKDNISGEDVGRVFWKEDGLNRIRQYCEKDVITTSQILLRFCRMPLLEQNQIEILST